jgi:hypothetical protein
MDSSRPGERERESTGEGQGKRVSHEGGKYKKREASDKYCRCNKSQHETPWCFGKYLVLKENTFFFQERREETYVHPQKSYTCCCSVEHSRACTFSHNINFSLCVKCRREREKAKPRNLLCLLNCTHNTIYYGWQLFSASLRLPEKRDEKTFWPWHRKWLSNL